MLLQKMEMAKTTTYALNITAKKHPDEWFYLDIVEGAIIEAYLHSLNSDVKLRIGESTYDSYGVELFTEMVSKEINEKMLNDYCEKYLSDIEEEW